MSDRDWDAEMRKIDRQIASIPGEGATHVRTQGAPASQCIP